MIVSVLMISRTGLGQRLRHFAIQQFRSPYLQLQGCPHLQLQQSGFATSSMDPGDAPKKMKTFYDILEITRKAKPEEVKEAYRKLAKRYHPDRNADDPEAEARFKEVQEAHATLSDSWKRALYDQDLQFGSMAADQGTDTETWKEHWDRETPEEREARKERYRRYAAGERNDLPPEPFPLRLTPVIALSIVGGVFYVCIRAPDWIDGQSDATFCDPTFNDTSVPLVRAYHNPVLDRWERLPENVEPPSPKELYAHYWRSRPDIMDELDPKVLPKVKRTVMLVPRTEAVKAVFRVQPQLAT